MYFFTYSSLLPLEAHATSSTAPGSAPFSHRNVVEERAANGLRSHLASRRKSIPPTRSLLWELMDLPSPLVRKHMMKAGFLRTTSTDLRLKESKVAGDPRARASSLNKMGLYGPSNDLESALGTSVFKGRKIDRLCTKWVGYWQSFGW